MCEADTPKGERYHYHRESEKAVPLGGTLPQKLLGTAEMNHGSAYDHGSIGDQCLHLCADRDRRGHHRLGRDGAEMTLEDDRAGHPCARALFWWQRPDRYRRPVP